MNCQLKTANCELIQVAGQIWDCKSIEDYHVIQKNDRIKCFLNKVCAKL